MARRTAGVLLHHQDVAGRVSHNIPSTELVRIDMESEGGLGGTSEGMFGPLACALVGYYPVEMDRFRAVMNDMEADMVKVRHSDDCHLI